MEKGGAGSAFPSLRACVAGAVRYTLRNPTFRSLLDVSARPFYFTGL
jgi:hypothetical protein